MACDGEIATEEVALLKQLAQEKHLFGDIDVDVEFEKLVQEINANGKYFLMKYLDALSERLLTEEQEIQVANVAVQTIRADQKVEYSEIKFFKVLRSHLKTVSDETILAKIEGIDENYLAQDVCADYLQMCEDYFGNVEFSKFELPE